MVSFDQWSHLTLNHILICNVLGPIFYIVQQKNVDNVLLTLTDGLAIINNSWDNQKIKCCLCLLLPQWWIVLICDECYNTPLLCLSLSLSLSHSGVLSNLDCWLELTAITSFLLVECRPRIICFGCKVCFHLKKKKSLGVLLLSFVSSRTGKPKYNFNQTFNIILRPCCRYFLLNPWGTRCKICWSS